MSAPTGAVRGGGRGRGRGGPSRGGARGSTGGPGGVPLAAQMKQLQRLDEPKEMAHFRRFAKLGLVSVESVYGQTGLLQTSLRVPNSNFKAHWGIAAARGDTSLLTLLQGETVLRNIENHEAQERALARRAGRLGAAFAATAWAQLTQEQKDTLLLSNAEYNRRHPNGPGAAPGGANVEAEED